jgi:hypothetical protein
MRSLRAPFSGREANDPTAQMDERNRLPDAEHVRREPLGFGAHRNAGQTTDRLSGNKEVASEVGDRPLDTDAKIKKVLVRRKFVVEHWESMMESEAISAAAWHR